jgi:hypothetical protein
MGTVNKINVATTSTYLCHYTLTIKRLDVNSLHLTLQLFEISTFVIEPLRQQSLQCPKILHRCVVVDNFFNTVIFD